MTKRKNPIEEYFNKEGNQSRVGSELFKGNDDFIDQMTELSSQEVRFINTLNYNDQYLKKRLGNSQPIFNPLTHKFMRLMVSHQRKSREEFVSVHKAEEMRERQQVFNLGGSANQLK